MPRLLSSLAILGLVTPAVIGLPVALPRSAAPHPVAPSVAQLSLSAVGQPAAAGSVGPALRRVSNVLSEPRTKPFSTVGVTWRSGTGRSSPVVTARWLKGSVWSPWTDVPVNADDVPDPGSADLRGARPGTAPLWVGPSTGIEVKVETVGGLRPQDLRLALVDPGTSPADTLRQPRDTANAAELQPQIMTRAQWGADESIRRGSPSYGSTVKAGFVHHTVNANSYAMSDVPALLRGIYAYHVQSNGWSDIGYNFVIDRFGRTWEGRYGGITRAVIGAHTGGFNTDTFAASLLGTYSTTAPPQVTLDALESLFAWKLGLFYRDPLGTVTLRSAGGGTAKYAAGTYHAFDVVSGHRDAGNTSCPGDATYARMGEIRSAVAIKLGPGLTDPAVSSDSTYVGSTTPIDLTSGIVRPATWTVDILTDTGVVLRSYRGEKATVVKVSWDLKDALGLPVLPGVYTMRLTAVDGDDSARPYAVPIRYRVPSFAKGSWLRPRGFFPNMTP